MDSNFGGYSSYQNNGMDKKDFNKIAQSVGSNIQKISQNVLSMKKMVNILGTPQDSQDTRQKLHQIQHYTNNLAKDTSVSLKELTSIPVPQSPSQQRECKMQRERLAEEFATALNAFQDTQRRAYQKEREEVLRNRSNSGLPPPPNARNMDSFGDSQLIELQDSRQAQAQIEIDELNIQRLEEQERAVKQLEEDISDVNQIFKELGTLVHEQGDIIDSIEASVEKTDVLVGLGATHISHASSSANQLRKKKCIICIILAVILSFLILILTWSSS